MQNMDTVSWAAYIIVLFGGINWLLIGLLRIDIVATIFGDMSLLTRLVYIIIGAAAGYLIYLWVYKKPKLS